MNKQIETAIFKGRETAAAEPGTMRKLDYEVGDFVQIRKSPKKKHIGRIGEIIGISYRELNVGPVLAYNVKFSDKEAAEFLAYQFTFVRSAEKA